MGAELTRAVISELEDMMDKEKKELENIEKIGQPYTISEFELRQNLIGCFRRRIHQLYGRWLAQYRGEKND